MGFGGAQLPSDVIHFHHFYHLQNFCDTPEWQNELLCILDPRISDSRPPIPTPVWRADLRSAPRSREEIRWSASTLLCSFKNGRRPLHPQDHPLFISSCFEVPVWRFCVALWLCRIARSSLRCHRTECHCVAARRLSPFWTRLA
jgi:hypothetical protein